MATSKYFLAFRLHMTVHPAAAVSKTADVMTMTIRFILIPPDYIIFSPAG
jgi:hypothetical protein